MIPRRLTPTYIPPAVSPWWDWLIVMITIAAVVLLALQWVVDESEIATHAWLDRADLCLCALFAIDFFFRFARVKEKKEFLRLNWIDLVAALPLEGPLRAARLVRVMRIVRLVRIGALLVRISRRAGIVGPPRELTQVALITLAIWLVAGGAFYEFEYGVNEGIQGIDDALWWSMTTLSTVGYGDLYPSSTGGRIVALITMVCGIGVLGTLAATVATTIMDFRERGRRGLRKTMKNDHLLVLGWNEKTFEAIDEFHQDPRYAKTRVVIVADLEQNPVDDRGVEFVRGEPTSQKSLELAGAGRANQAMVFAREPTDPRSDFETALIVSNLRRLNPELRISAELVDPENENHLRSARCDSVVNTSFVASTLLVRGVQDVGISDVVIELLSNKYGCEIYRAGVGRFAGKAYKEMAMALLEEGITVIGIGSGPTRQLSPSPSYVLKDNDDLFVIAPEPPDLA